MTTNYAGLIGLLLVSTVVVADDEVYVGGGLGVADVNDSVTTFSAVFTTDDDDIGLRIFGGYWFTDMIALELGYLDFGDLENSVLLGGDGVLVGDTEIDGVYGSINGRLPFAEVWYLQAHVGIYAWDAEFSGVALGSAANFEDDGEDLFYGIDIGRRLGEQFEIRGGFSRYEIDELDVDFLGVDLIWNVDFGVR